MSDEPPKNLRASLARIRRVYGSIIGMSWQIARSRARAIFTIVFILGFLTAGRGLVTRYLIDALAAGTARTALVLGIAFLVSVVVGAVLQEAYGFFHYDMADRLTHELDRRIMKIVSSAPGLDHLERSEFADKIKLVRERSYIPFWVLQQLNVLTYVVFGLVSAVVLLGFVHPLLLLMPVVAIPSGILQYSSLRKHQEKFDEVAPEDRLAWHYMELLTEPESAKEVRIFGLGPELIGRHRKLTDAYIKRLFRDRLKRSAVGLATGLIYGLSIGGSIAFIGWLALRGEATLGEVVMGVTIARMVLGHVEMAAQGTAVLAELSVTGERYLWMLDYVPDVQVSEDPYPAPELIARGIRFDEVGFVYPGTDKQVLNNVSLFIPSGSTVALVGENGAGKTTLVKLLSRFYDPTEGRILIDDLDLREIDLDEWRKSIGAAFQDFVRYQLLAREAVGVGDLVAVEDSARVSASAKFAGADRVIERLPQGMESQLGREFPGGTDLSEGEWQRVALARGAMRTTPALIILDEPTASLDARAEHEVFESFARWAERREGRDPITLLVSHRFSTVRMADMIVVMHEGAIEELGSHEELLSQGGRYAELFRLQASRYD